LIQNSGGSVPANLSAGVANTAGGGWTSLGLSSFPTASNEFKDIAMSTAGVLSGTIQGVGVGYDGTVISWTPAPGATALNWTVGCDSTGATNPTASGKALMAKLFGTGTC